MKGQSRGARVTAATAAVAMLAAGSAFVGGQTAKDVAPPPAQIGSLPLAESAKAVVQATEPAPAIEAEDESPLISIDAAERTRLANELAKWVTRHPRQLVEVIADLAEKQALPVPP